MTYVVKVDGLNLTDVQAIVRRLGYRPIGRIILRRVLTILINDIKRGRTTWPVDSGYSRRNFFTDGRRLLNYAPYAPALESGRRAHGKKAKRRGFIRKYWAYSRDRIVELALQSLGWSKVGQPARNFRADVLAASAEFPTRSRKASIRATATLAEILAPRGYVDPTPLLIRRQARVEERGLRIRSNARQTRADRARAYRNYYIILRRLFS